jgi:hypothetical protein
MNSSTRLTALLALPLAIGACSSPGRVGPSLAQARADVPAAIAVPTGSKLVVTLKGSGLQNYECRAKAGAAGGYDWTFVAPEAALRDKGDAVVGRHYGGPTWEYGDDSKVTGKVLADVPAPAAGNIPWLLLQGTASPQAGVLNGITYIQRINTSGGTAPSDACNASLAGTKKGVRYAADYLFYRS